MQIVAENLSYVYSEKSKSLAVTALSGINLTINEGDFFGIVGHTGSGKSTFIQHLNGIIRVGKNKGKLTVGEFNLADKNCDLIKLRSKVGLVFQYPEYQLFAETVKEDVAFGLKNFEPHLTEEEKTERVREALSLVGLDYEKYKDRSPFDLSGGQKRRVAIAGVIVTRPEVLVLDEPAAGLDPKGKRELMSLLNSLHRNFVKTVVIVSHDMNLITENCNRVAVFGHGKIIAEGTPKDIFGENFTLNGTGLELPVTAFLTNSLIEKGIKIDSDLTVDGFVSAFLSYLNKKEGKK